MDTVKLMRNGNYVQNKRWIQFVWLCLCFGLAVIVRTYKVADIPFGLNIDEAGMAYDAWSLQKYHVDRWLHSFPVYLTDFGDGQSALCHYLCALLIKVFGRGEWNVFLIRMPGILLNLAGYVAGVQIVGKILGEKWKMLSAFLLAVLPYFIMQCRFGLDCNLLVNMLTVSICLLLFSLEYRKVWMFLLTGIFYGLTYYTYALSYIPNTILLFLVTVYLFMKDKKLLKGLLCVWIPAGVLALPLFLMVLVNQFDLPQIQIGIFTITKLPDYRANEFVFKLPTILKNIGIVLSGILTKDWLTYNAFEKYYTMYRISIPFIVIGFCSLTKHIAKGLKNRDSNIDYSIFLWAVFVIYFMMGSFLGEDYAHANINKMNGIFFAQFFLLVWGIRGVYHWIVKNHKKYANVFIALLCGVYLFDFCSFSHYYFKEYAADIYPQDYFAGTYEGIIEHLYENHLEDKQVYTVYVAGGVNDYIYYLLSANVNPYEINLLEDGIECVGNFQFAPSEQVDTSAVYIIRKENTSWIERVRESGLQLRYEEGMYQCYY